MSQLRQGPYRISIFTLAPVVPPTTRRPPRQSCSRRVSPIPSFAILTGLTRRNHLHHWRRAYNATAEESNQHSHRHGRCDWSITCRPAYRHRNILIHKRLHVTLGSSNLYTPGTPGNLIRPRPAQRDARDRRRSPSALSGDSGPQVRSRLGPRFQVEFRCGARAGTSVAATNGCQVQVFSTSDGTNYDTVPFAGVSFVIANAVIAQYYQSFELPPGQYKLFAIEPGHNQRDHGRGDPGENGLSCRLSVV